MKLAIDSHNKLRRYATLGTVAQALSISVSTVRALIRRGELTCVAVAANCDRVPIDDLERYLQSRSKGRPFFVHSSVGKSDTSDIDDNGNSADPCPAATPEMPARPARHPRAARRTAAIRAMAEASSVHLPQAL